MSTCVGMCGSHMFSVSTNFCYFSFSQSIFEAQMHNKVEPVINLSLVTGVLFYFLLL